MIARGDSYIIIDEIISDISPKNLLALQEKNPIHLQESDFDISMAIAEDGTISQQGLNKLLYKSLDPFTTKELMTLYNENRAPWYNLLYQKVKSIANVYYSAQQGNVDAQQQYASMLRNSVRRTYEVDIRRMALEYIQFMYSSILEENEKRAQTGTTLIEQIIPEDFLLEKIKNRRAEIMKAKHDEFSFNLGQRMAWGYLGNQHVGSFFQGITTSAADTEDTHIAQTPLTIDIDIALGLVVQPDDFEVELYYSLPGTQQQMIPMQLSKVIDPSKKQYRYSATFTPEQAGDYQFSVAMRPTNMFLLHYLKLVQANKGTQALPKYPQQQIDEANRLIDEKVDLAFMKWSDTQSITVIQPATPKPSITSIEQATKRQLVESSL